VSARGALSATATLYLSALHSFVHASLQYMAQLHSEHAIPCVSLTDLHTTNLVDVNWTVTMIIRLRLPSKLLMIGPTSYFSASAPSYADHRGHSGHKFSAVTRLSRRLVDRRKTHCLYIKPTYAACIWWVRTVRTLRHCSAEARTVLVPRCMSFGSKVSDSHRAPKI